MTQQVKSRQRVADHGEVFTAEKEVKAMCDLVLPETERIDSRFLEPACGDGNFLAEILTRKLAVVRRKYRRSVTDFEKNSLLAVSSLYGVDILADNREAAASGFLRSGTQNTRLSAKRTAMIICAVPCALFSAAISSAAMP